MSIKVKKQNVKIKAESFERLESFFLKKEFKLGWNCLFVLPVWLKTWWDIFGGGKDPEILTGYRNGTCIGIAPLIIEEKTARFIGGENVCDYQDMIMAAVHRQEFLEAVLLYLKEKGVRFLRLGALRPESISMRILANLAEGMGCRVVSDSVDTSYEMVLPRTWDAYLTMLKGKQRHEIRRKMRRLDEAGHIRFRVIKSPNEISESMEIFFSLFRASRPDKSEFLTPSMLSFFRLLAQRMAKLGFFRMSFLDIDQVPAAGAMCFDYNETIFLYNSGYDPRFRHLSAGLLSKVYSIRYSIEQGRIRYDFLKGNESYKRRLGGTPVPLYQLTIDL